MLNRHVKLIRLILKNEHHYLNADEIASYLNVSNRTVRNDIKYINSEVYSELIVSVKGKGYQLNKTRYTKQALEQLLDKQMINEDNNLIKLAYQLLMSKQSVTLNHIAEQFMLSKNEINDYIRRIQEWCDTYDVTLKIVKKKGITVSGNEMNIRNAILHLNQLTHHDVSIEDFIISEIPKAHREVMVHSITMHLNHHGIQTSQIRIQQLLVHLIIIYKRQHESNESWVINQEAHGIAKSIIQDINQKLKYHLNEETSRLFSFFISYYFEKYELGFNQIFIQSYIDRLIYQMNIKVNVDFTQDKLLRENIYSHFSRTYLRITKNIYINNPLTEDIKRQYPFMFNALYESVEYLELDAKINLNEDEIAFLALHFQSSLDRNMQQKVNIVITCYYGLGISSLLEAKIKNLNDNITIVDTLNIEEVPNYTFSNIDILITTHDIDDSYIPKDVHIIKVTPLFSDEDKSKIKSTLKQIQNPIIKNDALSSVEVTVQSDFDKSLKMIDIFKESKNTLDKQHAITHDYIETALEREKFSSTYIGNLIAIPHGNPEYVLKSNVMIYKLNHSISWKQYEVKLVFFLAIAKDDASIMKNIIHNIAQLTEQDVHHLIKLDDETFKQKIIEHIKK
ncbi:BglG family transcription antiterminator [Mammaliicoccus stepanovicii]|uniref:Putative transcriptional regulator n=1 Tax=Mammaliicoccus stepanovicii TaxID=643214 RepID=A0A239YBX9_9STAP|nr:BglG family transcription antiterminator [Mammaliicoccus stepanovicii]PNZ75476.1 PTS mannose transporter subunit IIA [Mammaliicoccus stepanovicii]GGI43085.1 PTS mannose transporter subunit IIA [Mammaliicoccus stepanovicii]SNV55906.1 putative transcriptional regulator [Mammaliicoccus stepanovicii]